MKICSPRVYSTILCLVPCTLGARQGLSCLLLATSGAFREQLALFWACLDEAIVLIDYLR